MRWNEIGHFQPFFWQGPMTVRLRSGTTRRRRACRRSRATPTMFRRFCSTNASQSLSPEGRTGLSVFGKNALSIGKLLFEVGISFIQQRSTVYVESWFKSNHHIAVLFLMCMIALSLPSSLRGNEVCWNLWETSVELILVFLTLSVPDFLC